MFVIDSEASQVRSLSTINLNGHDLVNVRSILGVDNRWYINEEGLLSVEEIRAKRLCLGSICVTESDLTELLKKNNLAPPPSTPNGGGGGGSGGGDSRGSAITEAPPETPIVDSQPQPQPLPPEPNPVISEFAPDSAGPVETVANSLPN